MSKKALRDELAAAALTGMLGNYGCKPGDIALLAVWAYEYADAMLAAREGREYVPPPTWSEHIRNFFGLRRKAS